MIVGLPGAGISGLFYLICALLMPFHGAWRAFRGSPPSRVEWVRIGRTFAIASLVIAVLYASAVVIGRLVAPPELDAAGTAGASAADALPAPLQDLFRLGALTMILTLVGIVLSVRVASWLMRPKRVAAAAQRPVPASTASTPAQGRAPRVLITGGAGFIGSHIADEYVRQGWNVTVLDDLSTGDRSQVPAAAHLIVADVADQQTVDRIADARPELVIHAAAQISVTASMRDGDRDREVNLVGTQRVIDGAVRAGARRFVFISSGGAVYGDTSAASEQAVPQPMNPYGIHKLAAEGYVRVSGLSHAILRLANVYGPRQRAGLEGGVVAIFSDAIPAGRPVTVYGSGRQVRDFVNVHDVVAAVTRAAGAHRNGTWNVGTGATVSVAALVERIAAISGIAAQIVHAPARPGDVESSRLLFDRAWRDLGWSPSVDIDQGLRELVRATGQPGANAAAARAGSSRRRSVGAPEPGS